MLYLLAASLIWAVSFGLIKHQLAGLDACFVAFVRLALSLFLFLPLLRLRGIGTRLALALMGTGAVQYGVMYVTYIHSYKYLEGYQVALLTIFTPIYVVLLHDIQSRRFYRLFLLAACLAVAGAAVLLTSDGVGSSAWRGAAVLQISNVCFAFGQLQYRRLRRCIGERRNHEVFGLLYFGAFIVAGLGTLFMSARSGMTPTGTQWLVLLYLGILPSGLGFYLWNVGATRTNAGTLGVFNNAKIPLAVAVSLLLFGESARIAPLLIGGGTLLAAVALSEIAGRARGDHTAGNTRFAN